MRVILNKLLVVFYIFAIAFIGFFIFNVYNSKYDFYVDYNEFSMALGDEYSLKITPTDYRYFDEDNYIISEENGIVEIDGLNIRAINEGETTLVVKSKERFNVKKIKLSVINTDITSINTNDIVIDVDEEKSIDAKLNGTDLKSNLKYEVEDQNIAQVDEHGNIKAINEGTTQVKIIYSDDVFSYTNIVVKNDVKPTGISVASKFTLNVGDMVDMDATVEPDDATDKTINYVSSNESVAKVIDGKIFGVSKGKTKIKLTASNNISKTINVTVNENKVVEAVEYSLTFTIPDKIDVGDSKEVTCLVTSNKGDVRKCNNYTINNTNVVKIESDKIVGLSSGTATITVTEEGKTVKKDITVTNKIIDVINIKLNKDNITKYPGEEETLSYVLDPANATNKNVTWSSSNEAVATVSNGVVHANGVGVATITVTSSNGKKASCTINVIGRPVDVEGVTLPQTITLAPGDTTKLVYSISPENATDKGVTWSTDKNGIVAISQDGTVKAKKVGTVNVTVTTNNGKKTATCTVKVEKGVVEASSVELKHNGNSISETTLNVGDTLQVTAIVKPDDTTTKTVTWTSNNTSSATVSQDGVITAKSASKNPVTITAKTTNGKTATIKVTVIKPSIPVAGIVLSQTSMSMKPGDIRYLYATVVPNNATDKKLTWTSSNTNVVTVTNSGMVRAVNYGTATITVKSSNGVSASATVEVPKKVVDLIRGSIYNNGFLHYNEIPGANAPVPTGAIVQTCPTPGYTCYEYNSTINYNNKNNCDNTDNILKPQYFTLYPANSTNETIFQECHYEGSTKVYSATVNGNNDKLVKVTPNDEVQLDIVTYNKSYAAEGNTWPHLLITGRSGTNGLGNIDYFNERFKDHLTGLDESDRSYYYFTNDNQIDLSVDVKINSFNAGNDINGIRAFQYLLFLEIYCDTACGNRQVAYWFGFNLFDDRGKCYEVDQGDVRLDEKTGMLTVLLPSKQFFTNGTLFISKENFAMNQWKHVQVNLSSMIDQLVNQIHRYGNPNVKASDLRYGGFNIGYEVHGEYWASMSFKNLKLTSTKK